MKYVQVGILASLVVIAGLLVGIYRSQEPNEPPAAQSLAFADEIEVPEAAAAETIEAAEEITSKASPLRADRPPRRKPVRAAQTAPVKPPEPPADIPESNRPAPAPPPVPESTAASNIESTPAPVEGTARREPQVVTLPAGLDLPVRLVHSLSSDSNLSGDTFHASLEEDLVVDDLVIASKNARLEGRVVEAQKAGRVKGVSSLAIELVRLNTSDGQTIDIVTNRFTQQGQTSQKEDAKKVGIAAGIGAAIGAIAGGGKGAAVGAAAGAGAGGGQVLMTRGEAAVLSSETPITFRLVEPVRIVESL